MNIHLYGTTINGGFVAETSPATVDMDFEQWCKFFQKDGYHVVKTAPYVFDISRRDKDALKLVGILALEPEA